MVDMCPEVKTPACPERQIISLYLDGELPSPWKEKLEAHLESCPECRAALAGYRNLGNSLRDLPEKTIEEAQDRVWMKLTTQGTIGEKVVSRSPAGKRVRGLPLQYRTITVPLPAVAAAAAAIVIAFFALLGMRTGTQPLPQVQQSMAAANIGLDDQATLPIQDMNGVLKYLSSQDNGDFMVIRLPESKKFSRTGEPTLINAADYSRTRRNFSR